MRGSRTRWTPSCSAWGSELTAATAATAQRLPFVLLDSDGRRRHWTHFVGAEAEAMIRPAIQANTPPSA